MPGWIKEMKEGDQVEKLVLVKEMRLMDFRSKNGKYLHLVVGDATGDIEAKVWENAESLKDLCRVGQPVLIKGEVTSYRDSLQLRVMDIKSPQEEVLWEELVPSSQRAVGDMQEELNHLLLSLKNEALFSLAQAFLASPWYDIFCEAPAAQEYHHNYRGGLLEHSLGVMKLCDRIASVYDFLDRDLLLVGALLHDVGKVKELKILPSIHYSDEGRLLGHIVLGIQMADQLMEGLAIDRELRNLLLHMIASHHGDYQWQSPRRPQIAEARVLHLADLMDADVFKFEKAKVGDGGWSSYVKGLGTQVYIRPKAVNGQKEDSAS